MARMGRPKVASPRKVSAGFRMKEEDYEKLMEGNCLYAKKFQSGYSEDLIDLLEEQDVEEGCRAWG